MSFLDKLLRRAPRNPKNPELLPGAPGWEFIERVFAETYPAVTPRLAGRRGVEPEHDLTGDVSPIRAVSVYDANEFWHYVSLGMSPLFEPDAPMSPVTFELTMRVKKREVGLAEPPMWPVLVLNQIGRAIASGFEVGPGVSFRISRPEHVHESVSLDGVLALTDPQFGVRDGPWGKVAFVLLVGMNNPELESLAAQGSASHILRITSDSQLWLT